jgi:hypothetical protein
VIPKRVVFEGRKRTNELNIVNASNDTIKYVLTIVEMKMAEDGSFQQITKPDSGQNFASSHLRIFPKTITLAPNESQTVKVQLMNIAQMTQGEYRSHILFNVIPDEKLKSPPLLKMVTNLKVNLIPVFSVTIPVIVRIGDNNSKISFSDMSFHIQGDTLPKLTATFNRTGNMSAYGNISVEHISDKGFETHVATMKGLSVYVPNTTRTVNISLDNHVGVDYNAGRLRIIYTTIIEDRPVKIAESELTLEEKQKSKK